MRRRLERMCITALGLVLLWQIAVWTAGMPAFILPGPVAVMNAFVVHAEVLWDDTLITLAEIALGLAFGCALGIATALFISYARPARRWLLPVLVASQAVPVFALAPVLVLWFGYGMASKVIMAALVIFFPVTAAFFDGLRRTEPGWLDLARTMGASREAILRHVRVPAALPALGSGLRMAAAFAPIGAIIGEWVGSSGGLGYRMIQANARVQIDLLFAALLILAVFGVVLYYAVDAAVRRALHWQPESIPTDDEDGAPP